LERHFGFHRSGAQEGRPELSHRLVHEQAVHGQSDDVVVGRPDQLGRRLVQVAYPPIVVDDELRHDRSLERRLEQEVRLLLRRDVLHVRDGMCRRAVIALDERHGELGPEDRAVVA
jgi:hypothetical protein